ncbi:hypothetical protein LPJCHP_LPJCHP_08990, partial [Dysosmobacter welbionis]
MKLERSHRSLPTRSASSLQTKSSEENMSMC